MPIEALARAYGLLQSVCWIIAAAKDLLAVKNLSQSCYLAAFVIAGNRVLSVTAYLGKLSLCCPTLNQFNIFCIEAWAGAILLNWSLYIFFI